MATYAQVLRSKAQGRRQRWYVCGTVPALVQDAYELAQAHVYSVNVSIVKTVFLGSECKLADLEHELFRDYEEDRMLVVLHEADKFKEWSELAEMLQEADSSRFFIAVAHTGPPDTKDSWARVFVNSQRARFVVCNPMTPEDRSTWVQSRLKITQEAENYLIQRSHGDYDWLLNQIRRLEYLNTGGINLKLVKILCPTQGNPDFVDALVNNRDLGALTAIRRGLIGPSTLDDVVRQLQQLVLINEQKKHVGVSQRLLIERTGLTPKEISVYRAAAVYYDGQATSRCFTALTKLHEGLRRGSRTAYTALATRW